MGGWIQVLSARENIHSYEKSSCLELYEEKTVIIKLEKAQQMKTTQASMKVNFSVVQEDETEAYWGDIIGNNLS